MAEIVLQSASIVAVIGQLEAAGMASQHVRVDGERYLGRLAEPYHEMVEAHGADRAATLTHEYMDLARVLAS